MSLLPRRRDRGRGHTSSATARRSTVNLGSPRCGGVCGLVMISTSRTGRSATIRRGRGGGVVAAGTSGSFARTWSTTSLPVAANRVAAPACRPFGSIVGPTNTGVGRAARFQPTEINCRVSARSRPASTSLATHPAGSMSPERRGAGGDPKLAALGRHGGPRGDPHATAGSPVVDRIPADSCGIVLRLHPQGSSISPRSTSIRFAPRGGSARRRPPGRAGLRHRRRRGGMRTTDCRPAPRRSTCPSGPAPAGIRGGRRIPPILYTARRSPAEGRPRASRTRGASEAIRRALKPMERSGRRSAGGSIASLDSGSARPVIPTTDSGSATTRRDGSGLDRRPALVRDRGPSRFPFSASSRGARMRECDTVRAAPQIRRGVSGRGPAEPARRRSAGWSDGWSGSRTGRPRRASPGASTNGSPVSPGSR